LTAGGSVAADTVTVVMPIRNGAATMRRALDGLVRQTQPGVQIVVSDNQSTDGTRAIALEYAAAYPSIAVVQQPQLLSAIAHFRAAYELIETPYFMWAAHDDFHSPDYIEQLLAELRRDPSLSGAFPDLVMFNDDEDPLEKAPAVFPCETRGLTFRRRLRLPFEHHISMAMYAVWRREAFASYAWSATDIAEDWIMMWHALAGGDIGYVPGPRFYYYLPSTPKSLRERAKNDAYRDLSRFPWLRVYRAGARAAVRAWSSRGGRASVTSTAAYLALVHRRLLLKQWLIRRLRG
jgi:glycosyltransferase involved in cell wall biosynthesis